MPSISKRKQVRTFIEQRITNNFPPESRARLFPYSVLSQLAHSVGLAIHEMGIENERVWHNHWPQTVDPKSVDLIYTMGKPFEFTSIEGYYSATDKVALTVTDPDLDSFWHDTLPTRLSLRETRSLQLQPVHQTKSLLHNDKNNRYRVGVHVQTSLVDQSSASPWTVEAGNGTIQYKSTGLWGGGPGLEGALPAPDTSLKVGCTSTASLAGKTIGFSVQARARDSEVTSATLTVGYQSDTSASKAFTIDQQWRRLFLAVSPATNASAAKPYAQLEAYKSAGQASTIEYSDWSLVNLDSVAGQTGIPYGLRGWISHKPVHAHVVVEGGVNLAGIDSVSGLPSAPAAVTIEGINSLGRFTSEQMVLPYNGTHVSSKTWREITGTRVDHIHPQTAKVSVQLQNYQSHSGLQDHGNLIASPYVEAPLFHGLLRESGRSYLRYQGHLSDDLLQLVDGFDYLLDYFLIELGDSNGGAVDLQDIKLDPYRQHVYALEPATKKIHIYDSLPYWPTQSAISYLKERSPFPDMLIGDLPVDEVTAKSGKAVTLTAEWERRNKVLLQNRWTLHKPDGTTVGLTSAGAEVSAASDYWIRNEETPDQKTAQLRFIPQSFEYTPALYGDYVVVLEAMYLDEDTGQQIREKDVAIFSLPVKKPLASYTLPTVNGNTPVGIDFTPEGHLRVAYMEGGLLGSASLYEEVYCLHYDYYFIDPDRGTIYLREKYEKVRLGSKKTLACQTERHTLIVTQDTTLSVPELDNGFIIVQTTGGAVNLTLPTAGIDEDAIHGKIKRWGPNPVTILPGPGVQIDEQASKVFSNDKDVYEVTYFHSLSNWALH